MQFQRACHDTMPWLISFSLGPLATDSMELFLKLHLWWDSIDTAAKFVLCLAPAVWILLEVVKHLITTLSQKWLVGIAGCALIVITSLWLLSIYYAIPKPAPLSQRFHVTVETDSGRVTPSATRVFQLFSNAGHPTQYLEHRGLEPDHSTVFTSTKSLTAEDEVKKLFVSGNYANIAFKKSDALEPNDFHVFLASQPK